MRFLIGRIGAEKSEGNIGPRKKQRDTLDHRWQISSAALAATISLDPAGIGATDAYEEFIDFHGGD